MTDEQKQELISLIKTSAILNAQEREEWLMLLDLMNDKQAGELKRILAPKPAAPAPVNLPLNHIVNLPNSGPPTPAAPAPREPVKTFSKFAEHLNRILAEKDLPSSASPAVLAPGDREGSEGKPALTARTPLDLPKGQPAAPAVKTVPASRPAPPPPPPPAAPASGQNIQSKPASSIYDIMPVVVEQPIYLKKTLPPKIAPEPPEGLDTFGHYNKTAEERVQSPEVSGQIINKILETEKQAPPAGQKLAQVNEPEPEMADLSDIESLKLKPTAEPVRAGLQNQGLYRTAALKPQRQETEPAQPLELSGSVKLDEPADAAALNLPQWQSESPAAFVDRLKKITGRRGYYEVIFNLQKSPLYSSYIDSGLKSLEAGNNFEGLGENYMTKRQFEDFTDLLRELQV